LYNIIEIRDNLQKLAQDGWLEPPKGGDSPWINLKKL